MNILLNGLTNPSSIITFNGVPTILKIDSFGDGDKAKVEITVTTGGNTSVTQVWPIRATMMVSGLGM